jgi:hypothetical protein
MEAVEAMEAMDESFFTTPAQTTIFLFPDLSRIPFLINCL